MLFIVLCIADSKLPLELDEQINLARRGSKKGGGLEYKPFKMRGTPMQRNFGIGMENQGENAELISTLQNEDAAKAAADMAIENAVTAPTKDLTTTERSGEAAAKRHNKNYQRTGGGEQHQVECVCRPAGHLQG